MHGHGQQGADIFVGIIVSAEAAFEAWHQRLLDVLLGISGVMLAAIVQDHTAPLPAFDSAFASAAFRIDNLVTRRRTGARRLWRDVVPALRASPGGRLDILIDLRTGALAPVATAPAADELWSVDFLRGPVSPERQGMQVAVAGAGAFPITLERRSAEGYQLIDRAVCARRPSAVRNLEQVQQVIVAMIGRSLRARVTGAQLRGSPAQADQLALHPGTEDHAFRFARKFATYAAARGADSLSKQISAWTGSLEPHFKLHHAQGTPLAFAPGMSHPLESGHKQYLADPFLFRHGGRLWAFFEIFDYHDDTGAIGVAELKPDGLGPIRTIISGGGHMSYPHVFAHAGEIYMMPETCARRRIEVWRATEFPYKWELASTALEGAFAVDSDIHFDGSNWWVFTNVAFDPAVDAGLELSVYKADGPLLGKLTPHALNPVVADARYSRNGGRVFWRDGKLYRPAQSLEYGKYGYGLYIMEVTRLSLTEYAERPVRFIHGCHHLDCDGDDIIFDLRRGASLKDAADRELQA